MLSIPIISEFDGKGIKKAIAQFKSLETTGQKAQFALKKAAVPAAAALAGVAALGTKMLAAGEAVASADARIAQINKSMGLFGNQAGAVTDRLVALAEQQGRQYGIDNLVIKQTQAKLLTFANLAKTANKVGGAFDRANQAALDMAAAGFGSAEQNAVQLGKALENPTKGISALTRNGITFTAAEKEKIKALQESGKLFEAQDMILKAIEKQVGGTAAATSDNSKKIKESFAQVSQTIGEALLPVLEKITPYLQRFADWAAKNPGLFTTIAAAIGAVAISIIAVNAAMALNPFTAIAAGIALLVVGIVAAYKKFETFRNIVKAVVNGVAAYFEFVANAWVKAINLIIRGINLVKPGKDIPSVGPISIGRMGDDSAGGGGLAVPAMAAGGIVTSPTLALIGEAGPEAVVPLSRMGSMGGGVTINVHGGDPNAVVDALRTYMRQNGSVPITVSPF